jgi:hypothetical protein
MNGTKEAPAALGGVGASRAFQGAGAETEPAPGDSNPSRSFRSKIEIVNAHVDKQLMARN